MSFFMPGEQVTVVKVGAYNYAVPLASAEDVAILRHKAEQEGFSINLHAQKATVKVDLSKKLANYGGTEGFPSTGVLACEDSFIARESQVLFDKLGIITLVESGPTLLREMSLVVDEKNATIIATPQPRDGMEVVAKTTGRIDPTTGMFVCEHGEYQYEEAV